MAANNVWSIQPYYSGNSNYRDFLLAQAQTRDIEGTLGRTTAEITGEIRKQGAAMAESQRMIANNIVGAARLNAQMLSEVSGQISETNRQIGWGFQDMSRQLGTGFQDMSWQLGEIRSDFNQGMSLLNDTFIRKSTEICDKLDAIDQKLSNPILVKSRELYRRALVNYTKEFYEEAVEDLTEALNINKTDYISWFLLGKVRLFGVGEFSSVIDLDASVKAFTNAAKYIKPDTAGHNEARLTAAEILFNLGLARQTMSKDMAFERKKKEDAGLVAEAKRAYEQSWAYSDRMLESLYNAARCDAILGDQNAALDKLKTIIKKDRMYALKPLTDPDFAPLLDGIDRLIANLKAEIYPQVKKFVEEFTKLKQDLAQYDPLPPQHEKELAEVLRITEMSPYFDVRNVAEKNLNALKNVIADKLAYFQTRKRLEPLRQKSVKFQRRVSTSLCTTVCLNADGTVVAVGENKDGQCNTSDWRDIVAVYAEHFHTVGLKADGTVVAVGKNTSGKCNTSGWRDIVAVSTALFRTVGLKADGTVVATDLECNTSDWRDIVAISAGEYAIVGLKANGTVVVTYVLYDTSGWRDIVAISVGEDHVVGLKADGTVVATSYKDKYGACNTSDWRDIVAVSAGKNHTVGLKADGTVVATGSNFTAGWRDIVAVYAGSGYHTVGLKADGTVVTTRSKDNTSGWRDIVAVSSTNSHTVGLKADGTFIAVGYNEDGECNVSPEHLQRIKEQAKQQAEAEQAERKRRIWQSQGLCGYCGGKLSFFGNKCKSCGKSN